MSRIATPRALAVAALLIAVTVVTLLVARSDDGRYEVRATFDDARGLGAGADVQAGGVTVGTVKSIEIGDDERPVVTMKIDDDYRLHQGAFADIRLASNLGAVNRTVELLQGDLTAPELPEGARLSRRSTDQPVNFDDAVEALDPPTRRNLGGVLAGLDGALRGRGGDIDALLENSSPALNETATLLDEVNQDGAALRSLVYDSSRVLETLATGPEDLGDAAERIAALLQTTAGRRRELALTAQRMGPSLAAARRALDAFSAAVPPVRRLTAGLGPLVDALDPVARLLPETTRVAAPLIRETRRLVEGAPAQLRELKPIAVAADPVAGRLTKVARAATPLAKVLQVYIPETVGAFQNFGATAGAYDANGHILNVAATLAPTPPVATTAGGELGPSDCAPGTASLVKPGVLKRPYIRTPGDNECQPWTDLPAGIITPTPKGG